MAQSAGRRLLPAVSRRRQWPVVKRISSTSPFIRDGRQFRLRVRPDSDIFVDFVTAISIRRGRRCPSFGLDGPSSGLPGRGVPVGSKRRDLRRRQAARRRRGRRKWIQSGQRVCVRLRPAFEEDRVLAGWVQFLILMHRQTSSSSDRGDLSFVTSRLRLRR